MTACHYTPAEIDDLAFFDVVNLLTYWQDYPPVHEILKCVYKIERQVEEPIARSESDPSGIGGIIACFPDGFVRSGSGG